MFAACGTGEFHALSVPEVATAYARAMEAGDRPRVDALLGGFYHPLVRLRDRTPGAAVSLVKAGVRLRGLDVGGVRPPLADPAPDEVAELGDLIRRGLCLAAG